MSSQDPHSCNCSRCSPSPVTFGPLPPPFETARDALIQLELSRFADTAEWRQNVIEAIRAMLKAP